MALAIRTRLALASALAGCALAMTPTSASATEIHQDLGTLTNYTSDDKWKSTVNVNGRWNTSCTRVAARSGVNGWPAHPWRTSIRRASDTSGVFWSSYLAGAGRLCIENKDTGAWADYYTRVTAGQTTRLSGIFVDHWAW
ncbi:hypothetical protein [Streptomyces sp. A0592]|uniref:hypothetical protein n=1 Tax=Streptomyces sp. A0592 TaxID=2563099 RepID=UPI00109E377B|nr:hypothetical protein [Streptomyces sp. A0592]THA86240.1 hypothetical protein E6U81_04425 [Streptomyces sp. A0592]